MAHDYLFTIEQRRNTSGLMEWSPVMWTDHAVDMTFLAPKGWTEQGFQVFRVVPPDTANIPGNAANAKELKELILQHNGDSGELYSQWDHTARYYNPKDPDETIFEKVELAGQPDNEITIKDRHNGGKLNEKNPVYDFVLHFTDEKGKDVFVDPPIKNEY